VGEAAKRARRKNLSRSRLRSDRESLIIKLLIWQSSIEDKQVHSQRSLARQLGVSPSYVCKIQAQVEKGLDALARGNRVTLDDLYEARRFTAKLRQLQPELLRRQNSAKQPKTTSH
jgi:hypothetical protein